LTDIIFQPLSRPPPAGFDDRTAAPHKLVRSDVAALTVDLVPGSCYRIEAIGDHFNTPVLSRAAPNLSVSSCFHGGTQVRNEMEMDTSAQ